MEQSQFGQTKLDQNSFLIAPAKKQEACELAALIDMAGEGLASHLWSEIASKSENPGTTAFEVGRERARRESGGFSYKNAHTLRRSSEIGEEVCGMLLGYPISSPNSPAEQEESAKYVKPLLELENQATGSWYINGVAIFREFRKLGFGKLLLRKAAELAASGGYPSLSIIVYDKNIPAKNLYLKAGFVPKARKEFISWPGKEVGGNWELLVKDLLVKDLSH